MVKKIILFSLSTIVIENISAQAFEVTANQNNTAIVLTLIVAVIALILSVINAFNIAYNKRISEVNLVNQKDDIHVSMEALNTVVTRDIRGLRKELNKANRSSKSKEVKLIETKTENTDTTKPLQPSEKNTPKKKPANYKKRFYGKKPIAKKPDQEGVK